MITYTHIRQAKVTLPKEKMASYIQCDDWVSDGFIALRNYPIPETTKRIVRGSEFIGKLASDILALPRENAIPETLYVYPARGKRKMGYIKVAHGTEHAYFDAAYYAMLAKVCESWKICVYNDRIPILIGHKDNTDVGFLCAVMPRIAEDDIGRYCTDNARCIILYDPTPSSIR